MQKLTNEQLRAAFTKKEQNNLKVPDLSNVQWESLDFFSWIHPSGHLAYIVYNYEEGLHGIELKTQTSYKNFTKSGMCDLCCTIHPLGGVALFTAKSKKDKRITKGKYFCSDLNCSLYIRNILSTGAGQMRETISQDNKIYRLCTNLEKFIDELQF